jgi:renalase
VLTHGGHRVTVFDKSRGCGGRMATRTLRWLDDDGLPQTAHVDHGAPWFAATTAEFRAFADAAVADGCLKRWQPIWAGQGWNDDAAHPTYVASPTMPSLCTHLLMGVSTVWHTQVDALQRSTPGWQLLASDTAPVAQPPAPSLGATSFDAVVLAMPPAQAAALLMTHQRDWAQRASLALMQPCWTLMGVAEPPRQTLKWTAARPVSGPLAWLHRNEVRPGRQLGNHELHWVAHARAAWSREQLHTPAPEVQRQLQAALAAWLGEPVRWQDATVHRWRYARPHELHAQAGRRWWDRQMGLGVCGDFLGGGGVEGAWLSGTALAADIVRDAADVRRAPPSAPADSLPSDAATALAAH